MIVVIDLTTDAEVCRSSAICGIDGTNAPRTNSGTRPANDNDEDRSLFCHAESAVWIITTVIVCDLQGVRLQKPSRIHFGLGLFLAKLQVWGPPGAPPSYIRQ